MPGPQWSSPAVENGRVFVGSRDDHKLYAFDAVTGNTLWTATTSDWVQTSPAVANGVVYIANNSGNLYAFNAQTGGLVWQSAVSPGFAMGVHRPWPTVLFTSLLRWTLQPHTSMENFMQSMLPTGTCCLATSSARDRGGEVGPSLADG